MSGLAIEPTDEIEITPAMLKAGVMAVVDHDEAFFDLDERVAAIWRAMESARLLAERPMGAKPRPEQ